jgi:hypothetical protein
MILTDPALMSRLEISQQARWGMEAACAVAVVLIARQLLAARNR